MTPRIGLLLFTALLMQCENPVETPVPGKETVPAQIRQTDCFNGGNALFHAARITEMGNRASGTPGYRRQDGLPEGGTGQMRLDLREPGF